MVAEVLRSLPQVETALGDYLSAKTGRPVQVTERARLSSGWESDVLVLDAPGLDGDATTVVLRSYFGASAGVTALTEARVMHLLAAAGYPAPPVILVEPSSHPLGRPFLIMPYIDGEPLAQQMRAEDPARRAEAATQFYTLLAQLHALPWPTLDGHQTLEQFTPAGQVEHLQGCRRRFPLTSFGRALDWLQAAAAQVTPGPPALIHLDFHPHNILIDRQGAPWVIDWTQSQITDARVDLAWSLTLMVTEAGGKDANAFLAAYTAAAQVAGAPGRVDEMPFFEAFACARRVLSVLIALTYGAEALGMRPGAEATIARHLTPIAAVYARWLALTGVVMPELEERLAAQG